MGRSRWTLEWTSQVGGGTWLGAAGDGARAPAVRSCERNPLSALYSARRGRGLGDCNESGDLQFRSLLNNSVVSSPIRDVSRVQKTRARVLWLSRTLSIVQSPDTVSPTLETQRESQIAPRAEAGDGECEPPSRRWIVLSFIGAVHVGF